MSPLHLGRNVVGPGALADRTYLVVTWNTTSLLVPFALITDSL